MPTLFHKVWNAHAVRTLASGQTQLFVGLHLVHEVTSPQAFEGLKLANRKLWRISSIVATADHNTPTDHWELGIQDPISRQQVETLDANIKEFGALAYFPFKDERQGIVHVMGPENGATLPGTGAATANWGFPYALNAALPVGGAYYGSNTMNADGTFGNAGEYNGTKVFQIDTLFVPEPGMAALAGTGFLAIVVRRRQYAGRTGWRNWRQ